jgi:hypothetical protein
MPTDELTFQYIECDIPAGMTIDEYRRSRPRTPSLRERLARRLALLTA